MSIRVHSESAKCTYSVHWPMKGEGFGWGNQQIAKYAHTSTQSTFSMTINIITWCPYGSNSYSLEFYKHVFVVSLDKYLFAMLQQQCAEECSNNDSKFGWMKKFLIHLHEPIQVPSFTKLFLLQCVCIVQRMSGSFGMPFGQHPHTLLRMRKFVLVKVYV